MEGRGAYLRVGLLILAGIGLLVGLVVFLAGNRFTEGVAFETYFSESVQGLEVGAPVKFRGVTLGRVTDIGLASAAYGQNMPPDPSSLLYRLVFVRFVIDPHRVGRLPSTASAVSTGLRARLASQGLTGISYIELDFVSPDAYPALKLPWAPVGQYIPSMPSTLTQVQDAAQQLLSKLNAVDFQATFAAAADVLGALQRQIDSGDVHETLTAATTLIRDLDEQVVGADLPGLSADLKSTASALNATVAGKDTRALLANAAKAADRFSVAAARLPELIATLDATARRADSGTADLQQSLGPILRDLQATLANLRETSETLRQYPASVLFGSAPPRPPERGR